MSAHVQAVPQVAGEGGDGARAPPAGLPGECRRAAGLLPRQQRAGSGGGGADGKGQSSVFSERLLHAGPHHDTANLTGQLENKERDSLKE